MRVFTDASYNHQAGIGVIGYRYENGPINIQIIPSFYEGVALLEKSAVMLCIQNTLVRPLEIYTDHLASLKNSFGLGITLIYTKGHVKKADQVTDVQILFSEVDKAVRKALRKQVALLASS